MVSIISVSASCFVQSGVSVPEERSIADGGGRAGSRPAEHRCPGCQRRHRHPVSDPNSSLIKHEQVPKHLYIAKCLLKQLID